jgi:NAD(P)-dependent dehydrogenase (short-subunit alcohol dehydrogenase family)
MAAPKVWFITGASRGMGTEFARAALAAGHSVVATGRDPEKTRAAVGAHEQLLALALDVTDEAAAGRAVGAAVDRFGRIDVLVNNAGNFQAGFFEELTSDQFRAEMETNFFGPLNVTRAVLPVMRAQRSGHVVSISSTAGVVGGPFGTAYAASKFALEGWMEGLHGEVEPFGIRTTIVEPGMFRTKLLVEGESTLWADQSIDDYAEKTKETIPMWQGMNGNQSGDPVKLAQSLLAVVALDNPPERWVAGADSVSGVVAKGKLLIEQANAYPDLSTDLDHDDVDERR